jgi:glutathione S-transferase
MTLTLHELAHSPFCIPVRRILDAHRVSFETVAVPNWDRRAVAELTGGQYYQVPVLVHGGRIVHETASDPLAVAHYLDESFAGGTLFPDHCAGVQEIVIGHIEDTLEAIGFRLCDPAYIDSIADLGERVMVIRHKERKFGAGCVEQWRASFAGFATNFEAALAPYETRLAQCACLFGDQPVYADYALLGVLANAQNSGSYALGGRFSHLKRWEALVQGFRAG